MGGMGIFRVGPDGLNLGSITETLNRNGQTTVMAQRYLTEITAGDKRILVIDGVAGAAFAGAHPAGQRDPRQPRGRRQGRGAAALGARPRDRRGDRSAARQRAACSLIGLDVIGDCLTEINVTSPTGFQEIAQQSGFDVAKMFIDALERAVA